MKKFAVLFLVLFGVFAGAQTLVEVTTVMAIQSTLYSNVKFPTGSYKVIKGDAEIIKQIPDAKKFTLETYQAKGIAAKLQDDYIHQILTGFALDGFFAGSPVVKKVGTEIRTRWDLEGDDGSSAVVYSVRNGDLLIFVIGKPK